MVKVLMYAAILSLSNCAVVATCYPPMKVYIAENEGKATYAEAEYSRQVQVVVAKAKQESAAYEGEAEVIRAKKLAEANTILGKSLQGNEAYLRYLWIQSISHGKADVIYVPTEAGLPILEAGHRR